MVTENKKATKLISISLTTKVNLNSAYIYIAIIYKRNHQPKVGQIFYLSEERVHCSGWNELPV